MKSLRDRVQYLAEKNQASMDALGQKGVGINPSDIFHLRVETFMNFVLGKTEDSIERLRFEERFHEALEKALDSTTTEAERAIKARESQERLSRLHIPGRVNGTPEGRG